ncbi:MAG TPA: hypothetical protein VGJ44_14960, partial [Kribbellaceae bacterium]
MTDWPYGDRRMRFGLLTQPGSSWPELTEQWREAEDLGFDTAWVIDHFVACSHDSEPADASRGVGT